MQNSIYILSAKRTPMGSMLGQFSSLSVPNLGAFAHQAALNAAQITDFNIIDEVVSGCVLPAGVGQAPARQAAILANIPYSVGATTINKMCGSGMKAIMFAADLIKAQSFNVTLASGMESMSNAPYLLKKARQGYRLGHGELIDHMYSDGLEDAYDKGKLMGVFAENTAKHYNFSREEQDKFAYNSMSRALKAQQEGWFNKEIAPVTIKTSKGETIITKDEGPKEEKLTKIPFLKPAFEKNGTVTAANSSSISDGAASLILCSEQFAKSHSTQPIARILGYSTHSQEPAWFTTAPVEAIKKLMKKIGWQAHDVDLYEINEAFAVVALAAIRDLDLNPEQVNIHGGACALGHPIGASGARIVVTLIHNLIQHGKKRGIAALCIGGGEATALAVELL